MRILLIEDDQEIAKSLRTFLKAKNVLTDLAHDGEHGLRLALTNNYAAILLDYNLPKLGGLEIIEKIRQEGNMTPVIMITIRSELDDKIKLLNAGVDDYLTKPFSLCELWARIKAITRRPPAIKPNCLKLKNIELYPEKFIVKKNGHAIKLRAKEFALLTYLLENQGCFVSRQDIMEHVWDVNANPFSNTIEVHIMKLRKKLESRREKFIFTLSNRGYKIDEKE